jgi:hypothetical protein
MPCNVAAPGFPREAEESEIFLMGLFDPPYPDYDTGIAVYAGNDERIGRLPPLDAIGRSTSPLYENIAKRLATDRNPVYLPCTCLGRIRCFYRFCRLVE